MKPVVVDRVALGHCLGAPLNVPFNIASRRQVLSLPSGKASTGVPTGVRIAGRPHDEPTVCRIVSALESAGPGFAHPDWRSPL